jgi:hypothetical protein
MLTNTGVVASVASATETLLALIDPKNAIQWAAAAQPTKATLIHTLIGNRCVLPLNNSQIATSAPPKKTRQKTSRSASNEINLPKIPVNPKIKTMKCNMATLCR